MKTVLGVTRRLAARVEPPTVDHEVAVRGYVPVLWTAPRSRYGALFERVRIGHQDTQHWPHGAFGCSLWASGRRRPGERLAPPAGRDVAPLLPPATRVEPRPEQRVLPGKLLAYRTGTIR